MKKYFAFSLLTFFLNNQVSASQREFPENFSTQTFNAWIAEIRTCSPHDCPLASYEAGIIAAYNSVSANLEAKTIITGAAQASWNELRHGIESMSTAWVNHVRDNLKPIGEF